MKVVKMFYDCETTGVDPRKNSIIQLAGVIEVNGEVEEKFNYLIKPHPKAQIEPEALSKNKRTVDEIMQFPDMAIVYKQFTAMLDKYSDRYSKTDKIYLIGFNNRKFDDLFLLKFFELCGDKFFFGRFWTDSIDTICLASEYLIERRPYMPSFKLRRVALELGFNVVDDNLHEALYDVELTRKIYRVLTGLDPEPALTKFYYYQNLDDGTVFKTYEPCLDSRVTEIDFKRYKYLLNDLRLHDGPQMIQDDLM